MKVILRACHCEERGDEAISFYVIQPLSGAKVEIASPGCRDCALRH